MAFPWLRWFGSAETSRSGRRRSVRAQRRARGEGASPQEDPKVVSERRQRRTSVGIGATLLFLIIAVVAFGYYQEFYKPPRIWAGRVNNVEFTMGDLVQRIRVLQGVNRYEGGQVDLSIIPFEYLQDLVNAEILRQKSPILGISITDEDIEEALHRQFDPTLDPGQQTDPGQLEREFKDNYGSYLTATGLSNTDYRVIIEENLTEFALAAILSEDIEDPQAQVEIQWIQVPQDSDILANDVVKRLENEDFTRIAQELNVPSQFAGPDGYVGWVPQGAFPELDDILFGNEEDETVPEAPNTISEPIYNTEGFTLVKVLSGAAERGLAGIMFFKLLQEEVTRWQLEALESGTGDETVKLKFNSEFYEWVNEQVSVTAPRLEQPAPGSGQTQPDLGR